ncbi:MAG TPA: Flp family type IVb pilin [Pelagibacterium sp.]|uniref:Flp family type IVb pilin n=1 Tax=uncultured Pelagibacterium sp. TaxID=1159875 RepID=UPI000EC9DBCC|nr:Flp family type IVb pilin [Pelagibacterium sp.]|tara:strand:+ start:247 stop:447 length:201 start_codon:yes stop_codon:yes gene_type:complete
MNLFKKFIADDSGATAIEYGLIAALVAVVVIAALTLLGGQLTDTFCSIADSLAGEGGAGGDCAAEG